MLVEVGRHEKCVYELMCGRVNQPIHIFGIIHRMLPDSRRAEVYVPHQRPFWQAVPILFVSRAGYCVGTGGRQACVGGVRRYKDCKVRVGDAITSRLCSAAPSITHPAKSRWGRVKYRCSARQARYMLHTLCSATQHGPLRVLDSLCISKELFWRVLRKVSPTELPDNCTLHGTGDDGRTGAGQLQVALHWCSNHQSARQCHNRPWNHLILHKI